jgi:hypothetical protein
MTAERCPTCNRVIPQEKSDSPTGKKRDRITITVPIGEEGVLDELMIQVVEKYAEAWPDDARAARDNVGLELVGEGSWRFRVLHFALYAVLQVPGLAPVETGA